jgi:8-hydroxy-5-deazaflavin:NADPH oxidoreductase
MRTECETVAVIGGTGHLGYALATRWADAGVPVLIGSRDADRAAEAATQSGAQGGLLNQDAAREAAVVVLAVPFLTQVATISTIKASLLPGQVVVDSTVPLAVSAGGRPTRLIGVWQGSAAQQAAELVPDGVPVVAALHTVGAQTLADLSIPLEEDVLVCGDRKGAKRVVAGLIERIAGLRAIDAGALEQARIAESIVAMLIGMNGRYKTHTGIRITGLPEQRWWASVSGSPRHGVESAKRVILSAPAAILSVPAYARRWPKTGPSWGLSAMTPTGRIDGTHVASGRRHLEASVEAIVEWLAG